MSVPTGVEQRLQPVGREFNSLRRLQLKGLIMELCEHCGNEKEMYYKPWCPRCEKPDVRGGQVLNLIQALRYIEVNGYPGFKQRVWRNLLDLELIRNDSMFMLELPTDEDERSAYDVDWLADLDTIRNVFRIQGDSVIMEVSW